MIDRSWRVGARIPLVVPGSALTPDRRHGHPLQTVLSAGLIERPQDSKNRVEAVLGANRLDAPLMRCSMTRRVALVYGAAAHRNARAPNIVVQAKR